MTNKFQERLKEVFKDIADRFDEKNFVNEPEHSWEEIDLEPYVDDSNPYEGASWGSADRWHCIRCGNHLKEIDEKDPVWGECSYSSMRRTGTLWYQCTGEKCFHHSAPLILHHPVHGYNAPPGDSYSISWVK
jgi:hypothetical protein